MKLIQALREERTGLAKAMRNHYDKFQGDNAKNWNDEAQKTYDNFSSQIAGIDAQIKRAETMLNVEASAVLSSAGVDTGDDEQQTEARELDDKALSSFLRGGVGAMSNEQRGLMAARVNNAMSVGTAGEGGYTAQNEFAPQLIEAMKDFGGMRDVATILRTASGTQMDFPTADATSEEGEIVGENASVTVGETTFGTLAINMFKYSSKSIALPFELLQDSEIDLVSYIRSLLSMRLGRVTNKHYTIGTGAGQPRGIITAASVGGTGATGQTGTIVYDALVDLVHSVNSAYRRNGAGFMFNDLTLAEIKKLKDTTGRPLWLPGISDADPDRILNHPYTINDDMAPMAADAKSIAFGDFSKYIIRDNAEVSLYRMEDSKYTEKGQVGFLAFMRTGGNLIDVGGAVKVYQNSSS